MEGGDLIALVALSTLLEVAVLELPYELALIPPWTTDFCGRVSRFSLSPSPPTSWLNNTLLMLQFLHLYFLATAVARGIWNKRHANKRNEGENIHVVLRSPIDKESGDAFIVQYIQEKMDIEICSSNGLFMAQTGTISQFCPPGTLKLSESLLMSFLFAPTDEGVTAHFRSSVIAAASAAVEWILNVKLGF